MNFTALPLPESFRLIGWLGLLFLGWRWWLSGDWRRLLQPERLNLFLGATVVALGLWQIRAGVKPGLLFHLHGIAVLTLMFGFWRATCAGTLILLANALFGRGSLATLGLDALIQAALPAAVSWGVFRFIDRKLPDHFFVYVLGNGFFGGALGGGGHRPRHHRGDDAVGCVPAGLSAAALHALHDPDRLGGSAVHRHGGDPDGGVPAAVAGNL